MTDFIMVGERMNTIRSRLDLIKQELDESYEMMNSLINTIESEQKWTGNEVKAFLGFMDLMREYHGDFAEGGHEDNCVNQAKSSLKDFNDAVGDFYPDFDDYQNVKAIE